MKPTLFLLGTLLSLLWAAAAYAAPLPGSAPQKRILVLYSYNYNLPAQQDIAEGLETVSKSSHIPLGNVLHEYLDVAPPRSATQNQELRRLLLSKYAGQHFDLVVTVYDQALDFLLNEGKDLSPGTPCIALFCLPNRDFSHSDRQITASPISYDCAGTLKLALKLFPKTKRVLFVAGNSRTNQAVEQRARAEFDRLFAGKLNFEYLGERSIDELVQQLPKLSQDTIILYSIVTADRTGKIFVPRDVLQRIVAAAPVPTFGVTSAYLDTGILGGSVIDFQAAGAVLGRAIVAFEPGRQVALEPNSAFIKPMFNWDQLTRWGASASALPQETVLLNRPMTLWHRYRVELSALLAVIVMLSLSVTALALQNRRIAHAERQAKDSARRFRAVFDHSPLAIGIGELASGKLLEVNDSWLSLFGYQRQEVLGRTTTELNLYPSPEVRDGMVTAIRITGKVVNRDLRLTRKDGNVLDLLYSADILQQGESPHLMVMLADVTEQKRHAEATERLQLRQRSILDNLPMMAWLKDTEGRLEMVNAAYAESCGRNVEECLGKTDLDLFPDTLAEKYMADDREVCASGLSVQVEEQIATPRGTRWAITCKTPVIDRNGKVLGTTGIALDITEHRKLEEQLRQAQKMESVGRLAGGVAHDFNNKLSVILGYAELIKLQYPAAQKLQEQLDAIQQAAEHSRDITAQLLTFSRKQLIRPQPMNLSAALQATQKTLPRLIGEDITLSYQLSDQLWRVLIDPIQLDQIVMNLAVNARDAMPQGGSLRISTDNVRVEDPDLLEPFEAPPGDYVRMVFSDTGTGMTGEVRRHIFEPFFTTKETGKGTGLGLATIYGIVVQNHGLITVESEPDRGTSFLIFLPREAEALTQAPEPAALPLPGKETILVVEDDPEVLRLAESMLKVLGYTVHTATTPGQALALCGSLPIDLVLSDIVMPELNGRELVERIQVLRPGTKVVFMSGYPASELSERYQGNQEVHFIAKPFNLASLSEKVKEALG
ncbi:hypothetical protein GMLC_35990 [Geomonas limicola]|uniref:histidine kinase n=1 Tax=Geomonas limicola TaxID=2740186 RepID=A0A6V8NC66_9BACT|nr:PAS domain-containing sensor histidine kinase [Geomonas limicola]GFO70020.1 hypothetical protein GMLC_35990 [Geomonas limicola]